MVSEIVKMINDAIQAKCSNIGAIKVYGLAVPVMVRSEDEDNESVYPAIVNQESGECEYVFMDDRYSSGWYHRLVSKTYGKAKGFGQNDRDIEISEIMLVCWGFPKMTGLTAEQFETSVIIPGMPKQVQFISTNFDQFNVFSQEFKKIEYNIPPEEFLFSFRYRVQYPFNRECR